MHYSKHRQTKMWFIISVMIILATNLPGQTTGKISGRVIDADTKNPLPGANIIVMDTYYGAATDENGNYYIINLPPGTYNLQVNVIGYDQMIVENVRVSVNRTIWVNADLNPTVLEGQTVTVEVSRISQKKDQTGTTKNISSEEIELLPVENVGAIISMQAGVVAGHVRGGRDTEVSYMIDGIQVDESFDGRYSAVDIETEAIEDLEVITGTFNAEYGQAMSGVVNMVTKDGGNQFEGSVSGGMANYYSAHDNIFPGLGGGGLFGQDHNRNRDYKFQFGGPIIKEKLNFFFNYRYQDNKNHLNGVRLYNVWDFSSFEGDEDDWFSTATGDSSYVPMNRSVNKSYLGKLSLRLTGSLKISMLYTRNDDVWHGYNHSFKFNPDGIGANYRETDFLSVTANHMLSNTLFYELKLSYMDNYNGSYLIADSSDWSTDWTEFGTDDFNVGLIHDLFLYNNGSSGFFTGGQEKHYNNRWMEDYSAKFDLTWQINARHGIKTGINYTQHYLENSDTDILDKYRDYAYTDLVTAIFGYTPEILPDSTVYSDIYQVEPLEYSAYIQDKMEFDEFVINLGLRYDNFDPNVTYPSNPHNPANNLNQPDSLKSKYLPADKKIQISPRFGLAYQLGNTAILHFSYGHFFQVPPMFAMFQNRSFLLGTDNYSTLMGNPQLKSQKTVTYEIGLWQELTRDAGVEISLYYRDIYDLLSIKAVTSYNNVIYGLFTNKDYGNARGLEVKLDYRRGHFSSNLNYTLQYTRGNADTPWQTFDRAGDSMDPVNRFIPMSWDQRHTLNVTVGYNTDNYGVSLTGYYNSGTPYTFTPYLENRLALVNLYPNNDYKPITYQADLSAYYKIHLFRDYEAKLELSVYNLFDRLNANTVNSETGRPYTAIIEESDVNLHHNELIPFEDTYQDPSMYNAPRQVKLGLVFDF